MIEQDEVLRMAREAGFLISTARYIAPHQSTTADIERFAALVAAHEREACAKVCDEFGEWRDTSGVDCAAAIRGRGMDLLTQHSQNIGEYDER